MDIWCKWRAITAALKCIEFSELINALSVGGFYVVAILLFILSYALPFGKGKQNSINSAEYCSLLRRRALASPS